MKILFVTTELAPLIKVGGLGDVAGALPAALQRLGHDVRVVLPYYQRIKTSGVPRTGPLAAGFLQAGEAVEELRIWQMPLGAVPLYLIDIPAAFERPAIYGEGDDDRRFVLYCRGVMSLLQHLREVEGWQPDILHSNEWHTAILPNFIRGPYSYTFGHIATVFTIHNLAYQGWFGAGTRALAGVNDWGENFINFMARGIAYGDVVSTVSPSYAAEILSPEFGEGLDALLRMRQDRLAGILNGIDWEFFDPAHDPHIATHYDAANVQGKLECKAALQRECGWEPQPDRPLLGLVTRLVPQKGLDLVSGALPWLLRETDAQVVLLGTGEAGLEQSFAEHMRANPGRIHVRLTFDIALAQRIYAGSDMFLMPSRYEPGGLGQLIAMRYGTVPIVRATGGLNDTVSEGYDGNGFRFHRYEVGELTAAIGRALVAYRDTVGWPILRERGMRENHSWEASAREYITLYERALSAIGRLR